MKSNPHKFSQANLPIQMQILNISVNMARIANLVLNSYSSKKSLINTFINQTDNYLQGISEVKLSKRFQPTITRFKLEFNKLKKDQISEENKLLWSERALTWADILQIRAKLA